MHLPGLLQERKKMDKKGQLKNFGDLFKAIIIGIIGIIFLRALVPLVSTAIVQSFTNLGIFLIVIAIIIAIISFLKKR